MNKGVNRHLCFALSSGDIYLGIFVGIASILLSKYLQKTLSLIVNLTSLKTIQYSMLSSVLLIGLQFTWFILDLYKISCLANEICYTISLKYFKYYNWNIPKRTKWTKIICSTAAKSRLHHDDFQIILQHFRTTVSNNSENLLL